MRLICESCQHGYAPSLAQCPYCGAGSHVAHSSDVASAFNVESYVDYFCATFTPTGEVFQMFDGHPLDIDGLRRALSRYTCITFNGIAYDMVITAGALAGRSCEELKRIGDAMIVDKLVWWEALNTFNLPRMDWVDHIDIMNVLPGAGSLNAYGAKIHYPWLQDQPIDVNARLNWYERTVIREHCLRNCDIAFELYKRFGAQIKLREDMGAEYGLELRSKSDAQIAEAVMKSLLPFKVKVPYYAPGTQFHYRPPEWIKFISLDLVERLAQLPFSINPNGSPVPHIDAGFIDWGADQVRLDAHGYYVKRPKGYVNQGVVIAGKTYTMGSGGLHSNESCVTHVADDTVVLRDHDVSGYYPDLIEKMHIFPDQLGELFYTTYVGWRKERNIAKREGNKKVANSRKTLNNSVFGKLGSPYSIFYAPAELINVTLTGQLALLMLIEMLEYSGVPVVSANTDGIVLKCPVEREVVADAVIAWWEGVTRFETERTDYSAVYSRDVNSYVAIKTDGEVKYKGAFAPPEPGASGWPNPGGNICISAMREYLQNGTPILDTIYACRDITQFLYVRAVQGGGSLVRDPVLDKKATQRAKIASHGSIEAYDAAASVAPESEYLGKVVRWYYGKGSTATIRTPAGGLVARTLGAVPIMTIPETLPADIDYEWYITETESLLKDVGYK